MSGDSALSEDNQQVTEGRQARPVGNTTTGHSRRSTSSEDYNPTLRLALSLFLSIATAACASPAGTPSFTLGTSREMPKARTTENNPRSCPSLSLRISREKLVCLLEAKR